MKTLQTKEYIPLAVLAIALIITSVFVTSMVKKNKESSEIINSCFQTLEDLNSKASQLENELKTKTKDLELYNQIYNDTATEAELLNQTLHEETQRFRQEIENQQCQYPYRSVPSAGAFGMAWRMELMLDSLENAEDLLSQENLRDAELRTIAGHLYITGVDFQNLFQVDGVQVSLPEEMKELYKDSSDNLVEISNIYNNFDEYPTAKLKTRLGQLLLLQKNIISGMQGHYFLGN